MAKAEAMVEAMVQALVQAKAGAMAGAMVQAKVEESMGLGQILETTGHFLMAWLHVRLLGRSRSGRQGPMRQ